MAMGEVRRAERGARCCVLRELDANFIPPCYRLRMHENGVVREEEVEDNILPLYAQHGHLIDTSKFSKKIPGAVQAVSESIHEYHAPQDIGEQVDSSGFGHIRQL